MVSEFCIVLYIRTVLSSSVLNFGTDCVDVCFIDVEMLHTFESGQLSAALFSLWSLLKKVLSFPGALFGSTPCFCKLTAVLQWISFPLSFLYHFHISRKRGNLSLSRSHSLCLSHSLSLIKAQFPKSILLSSSYMVERVFSVIVTLSFKNHLCAKILSGNPAQDVYMASIIRSQSDFCCYLIVQIIM